MDRATDLWITPVDATTTVTACPGMTHPQTAVRPALGAVTNLVRPTLLPGLRRLWRDRHHLQLGTDPARAVVLELPDPAAAHILDLLDGSRSVRAVLAAATRYGIGEPEARTLLDALHRAGLVVGARTLLPHALPPPVRHRLSDEAAALALRSNDRPGTPAEILRRRAGARVLVTGHSRLVLPISITLARAGVGHVCPTQALATRTLSAPADLQEPATADPDEQLAAQIHQAAPGIRTDPVRQRDVSFVVQVGLAAPANLTASGYARRRLAHLLVSIRDGTPVVGPLVPPVGGPCLQCLELHRRDRDPDWSHVASQLVSSDDAPCAAAPLLSAAALAAGEVLRWLDGERPTTLGASVDVDAPDRLRRRTWHPHPDCLCQSRSSRRPPRTPL